MADPGVELHVEVVDRISRAIEQVLDALPVGEALDRERAGHCDHDTIWYDDPDNVTRCAACGEPNPKRPVQ